MALAGLISHPWGRVITKALSLVPNSIPLEQSEPSDGWRDLPPKIKTFYRCSHQMCLF